MRIFVLCLLSVLVAGCGGGGSDVPPKKEEIQQQPVTYSFNREIFIEDFNVYEPEMLVIDDYLYLADGINNIRVFRINENSLDEVFRFDAPEKAIRLIADDNFLYVKSLVPSPGTVIIYNISDPEIPAEVARINNAKGSGAFAKFGNALYLGGHRGDNITIYDIGDFSNIKLANEVVVDGAVQDIVVANNGLFAMTLRIIDGIGQYVIDSYEIQDNGFTLNGVGKPLNRPGGYKVAHKGNQIFESNGYLQVTDVSNKSDPTVIFNSKEGIVNGYASPTTVNDELVFWGGRKTVLGLQMNGATFSNLQVIETANDVVEIYATNDKLFVLNAPRPVMDLGESGGKFSIEVFSINKAQ